MHAYNPTTHEAKAGGSRVQGQSGLHSETLQHGSSGRVLAKEA
jgi:hypothetical protein